MSVTIELSDEVLARLEAEAERRGVTVEALVAESVTEAVAEPAVSVPPRTSSPDKIGEKHLAITGVGASGGRHGWARDVDERLAEGFGRD